jgi:type VI secretion system protein ImpA
MPFNNIELLLAPISPDSPCGKDLEYDPAFLDFDRISQGKPEQQMGSTIVPAQDPEWKEVASRAIDLLAKTKDLRIAVKLARALLNTEGLNGFADGLKVIQGIVENFWDGFYPKLDPDDGNDPTFRVNTLMSLCDSTAFIDRIRTIPLVSARSFGRFSLRDFAIVSGEQPPTEGVEPPKASDVDGAFMECPLPELQATADTLHAASTALTAIETFVGDKVGASAGPNFSKLTGFLRTGEKILAPRLAQRGAAAAGNAGPGAATDGAAIGGPTGGPSMSGEINSRDDVIRVLDKICSYYQRVEPSSPIPILLQRSKRLVSANFLDIVRDIAPDGLSQVENLRGKDPTENS